MRTLCTIGLAVLLVSHASAMVGQATDGNHTVTQVPPSANAQVEKHTGVVREIDDPHTGDRWMLVRDPVHPGGPGRLVLASRMNVIGHEKSAAAYGTPASARSSVPPVIHAGDKLIVEEHTAMVDARLEGTALGPAIGGAFLRVRLSIGGKVVRAKAVGPALAVLLPGSEAGR